MWVFWLSAMSGRRFRVWPHRGLETSCPPPHLMLTVYPQAELATSHKCLSHEVKRLTEENRGLRAEQLPSSAPRGLEQDESQEELLPSSVPVRGMWVPRAWGSPCRPFLSMHSRALAWDHGTKGQIQAVVCQLRLLGQLDFSKALSSSEKWGHTPFPALT